MGSTRKATVLGVIAASSAAASPKGATRLKPGVKGPNPSRAVASVLKPTIVRVRPWKLLAQTTTSARSCLIAPFACNLDRAFHRFGARVHGQNLVRMGRGAELLAEQRELVVHESPRGDSEPRRLLGECREDAGMAVPLIDRRIGRQTI